MEKYKKSKYLKSLETKIPKSKINLKDVIILKFIFEFKNFVYEANSQIRRRENGNIDISIGYYGDEFPCIILSYIQKKRIFKIDRIRAQSFGGYSSDDRMLCIKDITNNTFLPEKGSLDILIMLSLGIYDWFCSKKIINFSKTNVLIRDMAMKDEYPLSWIKYFNNYETTYSKYGFRIRGMEPPKSLCDDSDYYDLPNKLFSFEHYTKVEIPEILSKNLLDTLKKISKKDYESFISQLKILNDTLKRKKMNPITFGKNTTIEVFLKDVLETKRQKEYKSLLCVLDSIVGFDIRNYWFLDYQYYSNLKNKVNLIECVEID